MAAIRQHVILIVATCGVLGLGTGNALASVVEAGQTTSKTHARLSVHLRPLTSSERVGADPCRPILGAAGPGRPRMPKKVADIVGPDP